MTGLNHFTLLGIAGEGEERQTKTGKLWICLPVEVETFRKAVDGEPAQQEHTTIVVNLFSKTAEIAKQYVHPGDPVAIQCRVQGTEYKAPNGAIKRGTSITADQLILIPSGRRQGGKPSQ
jgi:single-stranded DNA-binding protein